MVGRNVSFLSRAGAALLRRRTFDPALSFNSTSLGFSRAMPRGFAAAAGPPPGAGSLRNPDKTAELEAPDDPRWDTRNTEIAGQLSRRLKRILLPKPFWYPEASDADVAAMTARAQAVDDAARARLVQDGDRELAALEALDHLPTPELVDAATAPSPPAPPCRRQLFPTWRPPLAYADGVEAVVGGDADDDEEERARRIKKKKKMKAKKKKRAKK